MLTSHHQEPPAQRGGAARAAVVGRPPHSALSFGEFKLDLTAQRLLRAGQPVPLQPRYFDVLVFLAGTGGRLVSKDELLDAVWGHRHVSDSVLKVAVNALRTALNEDAKAPRHLETVPRRGYRFMGAPVVEHEAESAGAAGLQDEAAPHPPPPAPAAPLAAEAAPAAPPVPPPGNLPRQAVDLVGRDDDLRQLLANLASHRLVTLHGPAGAGKTRLALAAAQQQRAADGVWLLRLDALADASLLLHTVARTLGLGAGADADVPALALALAPMQALLVLDSAEHVATAVAVLATALLQAAPGLRLLITSQAALRVAGEQVQLLGPLALPAEGDTSADTAAVQLLLQRARQRQPDLAWDGPARAHAGDICRLLDGLPLALELAAARVPLLGWEGVHRRLGERMVLLTRGERDAPERQRSLRAALSWSCGLLGAESRQLLLCLSVFAGSFTVQGAAAVSGISDENVLLDSLDDLLAHALLTVAETTPTPRWRLYDSVRSFAAEGLQAQEVPGTALRRLLDHLATVFEQADRDFAEVYQRPWLRLLQPEADNLRGALAAALPLAALRTASLRLFCSSTQFRARAGWRRELRRDHAVISSWPAEDRPLPLQAAFDLARAHLGATAQVLPPQEALGCARRAAQHYGDTGQTWLLYSALALESGLLLRVGARHEERQATVARMQALHAADWSPARRRQGHWHAMQLLRQRGDDAAYEAAATRFLVTSRALGDDQGAWNAAQVLAQSQAAQGQFANAIALLERTTGEMRAAGELRQNVTVLAQWVLLRLTQDADAATVDLLQLAIQALAAEDMVWWLADALAWVPTHRGQWAQAIRLQAWADSLAQQRGDTRGPLFAAVRRHWQALFDQQPQACEWREHWPAQDDLDERSALGLVFGTP